MGLGLWKGEYQGINRLWLRWYDSDQNWMLTPTEQAAQRVAQEAQWADRLAAQLRALGIEPDA
jgi:hypothetical protein